MKKLILLALLLSTNVFAYGDDLLGDYVKEQNQRSATMELQRQQTDALQQQAKAQQDKLNRDAANYNSSFHPGKSFN